MHATFKYMRFFSTWWTRNLAFDFNFTTIQKKNQVASTKYKKKENVGSRHVRTGFTIIRILVLCMYIYTIFILHLFYFQVRTIWYNRSLLNYKHSLVERCKKISQNWNCLLKGECQGYAHDGSYHHWFSELNRKKHKLNYESRITFILFAYKVK